MESTLLFKLKLLVNKKEKVNWDSIAVLKLQLTSLPVEKGYWAAGVV